jgi:hypothetical protein
MALGLSRALIEAEVLRDLMYSGLDSRAQLKVAEAIVEAIDKNNRRIQEQLIDLGITDSVRAALSEPHPVVRRVGVI